MRPPIPSSALPPKGLTRRSTSIDFAENQLSPGLIGLSPLATVHPPIFQHRWVRSSSACYCAFNLTMARSPGFGSDPPNSVALFRLAFAAPPPLRLKLARQINSLTHYTKGTPSPVMASEDAARAPTDCRHPVSGTVSLPSSGFFSPFPHGTGTLSVVEEYLGLEGGPPVFRQDFTCPVLLGCFVSSVPVLGYHLLWRFFPETSSWKR